jgi:hypothetical protein
MENEMLFRPGQMTVSEQDISNINHILQNTGVSLPVGYSGKRQSWQLPASDELLEGLNAQRKRLQKRNLQLHRQSLDLARGQSQGTSVIEARNVYADGDYRIGRLRKKWQRITTYLRNKTQLSSFKNTTWIDYYIKKEPGEECKVSSLYIPGKWGFFGRDEEYVTGGGNAMSFLTAVLAVLLWILFGLFFFLWMILAFGSTEGAVLIVLLRVMFILAVGGFVATGLGYTAMFSIFAGFVLLGIPLYRIIQKHEIKHPIR